MSEQTKKTAEQQTAEDWLARISEYDQAFSKWEKRTDRLLKKYRDEDRDTRRSTAGSRFNCLWSNVQILLPATFSRLPKPDVSRRHRDNDPVGRVASLILERALEYEIGEGDYRESLEWVIQDRFLGGRGTAWVRYEPSFVPGRPEFGMEVTEDAELPDVLDWEHSPVDYVHWRDFGHTIARTWAEVTAVWRKVYMSRDALVERFGEEEGRRVPLDTTPDELKKAGQNLGNPKNSQALIYEIWDKAKGQALWISKSLGEVLDSVPDPLKLAGFWPCPKPLYATLTSDSLVPLPDYALYQDQAQQLDALAETIDGLVKSLKVRGVYDAATPELARIFSEGENTVLIPVKNWAAFVEKNGLKGAIDLVDLAPIASALKEAYLAFHELKAQIDEITGISDIIRGDTDANETASAQKLKSTYGNLRLKSNQGDVALFATELLRIKAQIMCRFYDPQTLLKMAAADQLQPCDQQVIPQALALLKDNVSRCFRIDVEADSMVMMDEQAEQAGRMAFLSATGKFIQEAMPIVQESPEMAPLALEMLKFGVGSFKMGKTLEGVFDEAAEKIKQATAQKAANPKPDPEMLKAQSAAQLQQTELQAKIQMDQAQKQHEMQLEQFKAQQEMAIESHRQQVQAAQVQQQNALEAQRDQMQSRNEMALEQMRMALDKNMGDMQQQMALLIARLNNAAKVEVAEIAAQTTLDAAQIGAARQAEGTSHE